MEMVWLILFLCARVEQLAGKVVENEPLRTVQTREVEIERPSLDWLIDSRLKLDSRFNLYHFHTHTRFGARILATRTFRVAGVCILLTQTFGGFCEDASITMLMQHVVDNNMGAM